MPLPKKRVYFPQLSDVTKFQRQFTQNTQDIIALRNALNSGVGTVVAGGGPAIENIYADVATMFADQTNQTAQSFQRVDDASGDVAVTTGYAYYEYLGTVVGDITDYKLVASEESLAVPIAGSIDYAELAVLTSQNVGGVNGTETLINWDDTAPHVGTMFTHSTSTNPSRLYVTETGRYSLVTNMMALTTGANRTSLVSRLKINGTTYDNKGQQKGYTRGSIYGLKVSVGLNVELDLTAGDYIEVGTYVQDTDATYTLNTSIDACYLVMRRVIDSIVLSGPAGPAGAAGGIPTVIAGVTADTVDVDNFLGNVYNTLVPYTGSSLVIGATATLGQAIVRIDTTGKIGFPSVVGATQTEGSAFVAATIYDITFQERGGTIEYWFVKINPA